ncbi:MAG: 50S ribosomal protein L11 methyltransferase [Aristaeellaceae bacterium]
MDWVELTIHTTSLGADIVSEALMNEGATGTMVEDRADIPDPDKPNGYWEIIDPNLINTLPEDVLVHAWFEPDERFADRMGALKSRMAELKAADLGIDLGSLEMNTVNVRDEDWAEVWKKFYKPFRAGQRLVVKPTWEHYDAQENDLVMEIDPGMAFGSGTHETTGMCLALLEDVMLRQPVKSVIDVGTGSGILAIGSAMLGAKDVLAIDIDPTAVKVARENVAHNGLQHVIRAVEGNLLESTDGVCEVCVANIIADVICMFAKPLIPHIVPGGLFICSGIIKEREQDVVNALNEANYTILEIRRKGEWVAILSRRPD